MSGERGASRRSLRGPASAAALVALVAGLSGVPSGPTTAAAVDAVESGWWMAPIGVAPDAPSDGLVVQGGPADPLAYGAVRFVFADPAVESLLLRVAPDSASTPNTTLALCPLTERFTPVQGGAIADAPAYDCETSSEATPSADGTTYTFEVAPLIDDGVLAVAVLPTSPTDRVVLSAAGPFSLIAGERGTAPPTTGPPPPPLPPSDPLPALPDALPSAPLPLDQPLAVPPVPAPTQDSVAAGSGPQASGLAVPAAQTGGSAVELWPFMLLLAGLAAAAGLWSAAGAGDEDQQLTPGGGSPVA